MLQLTKRVDYALIALTHLAVNPGERVSARELAASYQLSPTLLANVLKSLAREGLLASIRGTKGGYALCDDGERVTVGRVVELLEGPLKLADCIGEHPKEPHNCAVSKVCPVKQSVLKIHLRIRDVLYGMTIASLARGAQQPGEQLPVLRSLPSALPVTRAEG